MPAVRVVVRDEADGADLEEAFTTHLNEDGRKTIFSFEASDVTINDTDFTQAEVTYNSADSMEYQSLIIGLVRDGEWIIFEAYSLPAFFPFSSEEARSNIINSVAFE